MQDNNNSFQQTPGAPPTDDGLPMPPTDLPPVRPPAPRPRRAIDGVSLDYSDNEPLPAPEPVSVPEQPAITPAYDSNSINNVFMPPVQPEAPVAQPETIEPTPLAPQIPLTPVPEAAPIEPTAAPIEAPVDQPEVTPADMPIAQPMDSATNDEYLDQLTTDDLSDPETQNFGPVPSLSDNYEPSDIIIENPKPKKFNWVTTILIAVAILGIGASIFLFIQYRSISGQLQNAQYQMEQYQMDAESGQKASMQLESLQSTIREQSEKINDLKKENDELQNVSDDLKKTTEDNKSLREKNERLSDQMSKCLADKDCRKFL